MKLTSAFKFFNDLFYGLKRDRKYILIPLIFVLLIVAAVWFIVMLAGPTSLFVYPFL